VGATSQRDAHGDLWEPQGRVRLEVSVLAGSRKKRQRIPQSKPQARHGRGPREPKVLECGSPLPLFCRSTHRRPTDLITPVGASGF